MGADAVHELHDMLPICILSTAVQAAAMRFYTSFRVWDVISHASNDGQVLWRAQRLQHNCCNARNLQRGFSLTVP